MTRIAIIAGSTRPGRKAATVAAWVHQVAHRHCGDGEFDILDVADFDLPLLDEPAPPMMGDYRKEHTQRWAATIASYDGYILVTPEYNHGPSAALKNALDYLYREWNDKAVGFVGYGVDGATRSVEQLRLVAGELQLAPVRNQVALSLTDDFADMSTLVPQPHQEKATETMLDQLIAWSAALRTVRSAA